LLGLWVRITLGALIAPCCECCVLSGRALCVGLITRLEESTDFGLSSECDREAPEGVMNSNWFEAPPAQKIAFCYNDFT